jgi:hypothetical protein
MREYKGYLIDEETNDHACSVLTLDHKHVYTTGNLGRAKSFIDGLTFEKVFEDLETDKQLTP